MPYLKDYEHFIYNDKKYKYSTFLDEYKIPYYNIGDLK